MRIRWLAWMLALCLLSQGAALADSAPQWQWRSPVAQWNALNAVAYGAGQFVAVGEAGAILTSSDGKSWHVRPAGIPGASLVDVAYGGGTWVALGESGRVAGDAMERTALLLTSADGVTWAVNQRLEQAALEHVVYGGGRFLVTGGLYTPGEGTRVELTSADGVTWERHDQTGLHFFGVAHGAGQFVAATSLGILSSADGVSWTERFSLPEGVLIQAVAFDGAQFVAAGGSGNPAEAFSATSADGMAWQPHVVPGVQSMQRLAVRSGGLVVLGQYGGFYRSMDGVNWAPFGKHALSSPAAIACGPATCVIVSGPEILTAGEDGRWQSNLEGVGASVVGITAADGALLAIRNNGLVRSTDGVTWSETDAVWAKGAPWEGYVHPSAVAYGNGWYVGQGRLNLDILLFRSRDGVNWPQTNQEYYPQGFMSLRFLRGRFFWLNRTSVDGEHWVPATGLSNLVQGLVYGNGQYMAWDGMGQVVRSGDGVTWSPVETSLPQDRTFGNTSLGYGGGLFLMARGDLQQLLLSPDGQTWAEKPWPFARRTPRFTYGGGRFLATAPDGMWTSADGVTWAAVPGISTAAGVADVTYALGQFVGVGQSGTVFTGQVCGGRFPDVPAAHPACDPVELLASRHVVGGFPDGSFRPETPVTRAELTKLLTLLLEISPAPGDRTAFSDTVGHWAANEGYIQAMTALGAVNGYPDGTFRPDGSVTRAELIKLTAALAGLSPAGAPPYRDVAAGDWYAGWAARAVPGRLIGGGAAWPLWTGDALEPDRPATRAEAAMLLGNMLDR